MAAKKKTAATRKKSGSKRKATARKVTARKAVSTKTTVRKKKVKKSSAKRKYSRKSAEIVEGAMKRMKSGSLKSGGSGKKVTSRKQAIAIGLSEARRKGAKAPAPSSRKSKS